MLLNFREEKKGEIEREQLREIIEIARETILYIISIEEGERLLREGGRGLRWNISWRLEQESAGKNIHEGDLSSNLSLFIHCFLSLSLSYSLSLPFSLRLSLSLLFSDNINIISLSISKNTKLTNLYKSFSYFFSILD